MQVTVIPVSKIEASNRLRPLNKERVSALKASLAEVGLINPISVYAHEDGTMLLAAGAHRLQAARELEWETIPAVVTEGAEVDRLLVEIDENLCRSELSQAERAQHEARRKELWTAKHALEQASEAAATSVSDNTADEMGGTNCPTHPAEGDPEPDAAGDQDGGEPSVDSRGRRKTSQQQPGFAASTAAITGENKRAINRNIRRGEELGGETLHAITGTSLDKGLELDALMKLPPEERADLVNRAKAGEEVSARKTLEARTKTPEDKNKGLAKRAVAALEKCAGVMDESEFGAALKEVAVPGTVARLAEVILQRAA